jgi:hypothetical protein
VVKGRYLIPGFFAVSLLAGEITYLRPIAGSVLATLVITDLILPFLRDSTPHLFGRITFSSRFACTLIVTLLILHGAGTAGLATQDQLGNDAPNGTVEIMEHIPDISSAESRYLIIDPSPEAGWWVGDWFPVLSERAAIDVPYGSEWTSEYEKKLSLDGEVNNADSLEDLRAIQKQYGTDATNIFIIKEPDTAAIRRSLGTEACAIKLIENQEGVVYDVRRC